MSRRGALIFGLGMVIACGDRGDTPETRQAGTPAAAPASLASAPDQFLVLGDLRLRYRDAGSRTGTPIVFVHGYSRSLEDWVALSDTFAANHRVIAYDARGFGQSAKFTDVSRYGIGLVEDVASLLDHLRIDRAYLIGHSMGALVAANAAFRHPHRVAGVALIATPAFPDSIAFARGGAPWLRDLERGVGLRNFLKWQFPGMPDSVARGLSMQTMAANDSASMVLVMRAMGGLAVDLSKAAASAVPAVIAVGGRDPLAHLSRTLAARWPNARFVEVPEADHVSVASRAEVIATMKALVR